MKTYDAWLKELRNSSDSDLREIGEKAAQAAWTLETIADLDSSSIADVRKALIREFGETDIRCEETDEEITEEIKDGWYTIHGHKLAVWTDSPAC